MTPALRHLRSNVIAYLALFIAVGGTGYAAANLPNGSVGANQIKNHAIQPVKLDQNYIGGNVRLWGHVSAAGKFLAGGAGATIEPQGDVPGDYLVFPSKGSKLAIPGKCAIVASVDDNTETPGFAMGEVGSAPTGAPWSAVIRTENTAGQSTPLAFDFAVIC